MTELYKLIENAESNKPAMDEPCNHCGWCCLTEVCDLGKEITGTSVIPCRLLEERDDGYYCKAASTDSGKVAIGAGVGCCAKTQTEVIAEFC